MSDNRLQMTAIISMMLIALIAAGHATKHNLIKGDDKPKERS